jgi:hypothetical protein
MSLPDTDHFDNEPADETAADGDRGIVCAPELDDLETACDFPFTPFCACGYCDTEGDSHA